MDIQKVELVDGQTWLSQNLGSLVLAVAAFAAAALAAYVSIRNQREQLAHDRLLRNQDHIRDTIDAAVVAANQLRMVMDRFSTSITTMEDKRTHGTQPLEPELKKRLIANREEVMSKLHGVRAARTRLEVRLQESEPVVVAYRSTLNAFTLFFKELYRGIAENREQAIREGDDGREAKVNVAFKSFQNACRDWESRP